MKRLIKTNRNLQRLQDKNQKQEIPVSNHLEPKLLLNTDLTSFIGHCKGNGISPLIDGINWIRVTNLTKSFTGQFFSLDSIIALAITAAGSSDVSDVQMKFRRYDNI